MRVAYMLESKKPEIETAREIQGKVAEMVREFDVLITSILKAQSGKDLHGTHEQPKKPGQSARG